MGKGHLWFHHSILDHRQIIGAFSSPIWVPSSVGSTFGGVGWSPLCRVLTGFSPTLFSPVYVVNFRKSAGNGLNPLKHVYYIYIYRYIYIYIHTYIYTYISEETWTHWTKTQFLYLCPRWSHRLHGETSMAGRFHEIPHFFSPCLMTTEGISHDIPWYPMISHIYPI